MKHQHNPNSDYIVIDGIYFYKEGKGNYYLGNVKDESGKPKPVRAHVYVWEKHYGKKPPNCSIHHIDKDPRNNDISNLRLMNHTEHLSFHALEHSDKSRERMETVVRPLAVEWHKSEEGRQWHKEHYANNTRERWNKYVTKVCTVCGKEYQVKSSAANRSKYCSSKCKEKSPSRSAYNEAHPTRTRDYITSHTEERICQVCGKTFSISKYYKKMCCSPECRGAKISQSRIERYSNQQKDC